MSALSSSIRLPLLAESSESESESDSLELLSALDSILGTGEGILAMPLSIIDLDKNIGKFYL